MIGRKSLLALYSHIIVQICNVILYFFAVNKFLPLQFGYYQIASAIIAIFSLLSTLGFADAYIKITAENKALNEAFTTYTIIKILLIFISIFVTILMVFIQVENGLISNDIEQLWIIGIIGINSLLMAIYSIYELNFRGTLKFAKLEVPVVIGVLCGTFFSLISILFFENFILYLCGNTIANSIILVFYIYFGKNLHFTRISLSHIKRYLFLSIAFTIPLVLITLRKSLGSLLFLNYFDEELLGVYWVITSFFNMVLLLQKSFSYVLIPSFTTLTFNQNLKKLKHSIYLFSKYMIIVNGILIIAGIIFAEVFLRYILGEFYFEKGLFFFYCYLITMLNFPLIAPYASLIIVTEKVKMYIGFQILPFVFSLISWIFFFPMVNIIGIELGGWIAIIPNLIITRIYCAKHIGVYKLRKQEFWNLIMLFILIFISFIASTMQFPFLFKILIFIIISGSYFLFLFSTKIMKKEDIKYIIDILNPKKMINYIKKETLNNKN